MYVHFLHPCQLFGLENSDNSEWFNEDLQPPSNSCPPINTDHPLLIKAAEVGTQQTKKVKLREGKEIDLTCVCSSLDFQAGHNW